MKRLLGLPTGFASRVCALCSLLLLLTGAAALAQSAGAANSPPAPAQPSATNEAGGGCEPIGLTASGEIVFPFRCKDAVERQRAAMTKPAEPKPAAAPAAVSDKHQEVHQEKGAAPAAAATANLAAGAATAKPEASAKPKAATKPVAAMKPAAAKPAATAKPAAPMTARDHAAGPRGCSLFRSYDAEAGTYLAFDGQRRPCHEAAAHAPAAAKLAGAQAPQKPAAADSKQ